MAAFDLGAGPNSLDPLAEELQPARRGAATLEHQAALALPLFGRIVDAESGAAVTSFLLACLPAESGATHEGDEHGVHSQDVEGRFSRDGLRPGLYDLVVDPAASGYERTILRGLSLPCEQEIVIRAGRGPYCEGHLTDARGAPLAGVMVSLERLGSVQDGALTRRSGPQGEYLFTLLAPGQYRLSHEGSAPDQGAVLDVGPQARLQVDLRSTCAGRLSITVVDELGLPIAGSSVLIAGRGGERRRASTDPDGMASIAGLPTGSLALRVTHVGFAAADRSADLAPSEARAMTFRLRPTPR